MMGAVLSLAIPECLPSDGELGQPDAADEHRFGNVWPIKDGAVNRGEVRYPE